MSNSSTAPSVVVAFDETLPDFEPEPVRRPAMKTGLVNTFKALPLTLDRGDGVWVWDTDGRQYLDMYSGHAVASTGHAHPHVAGAIAAQARRLVFYSNVVDLEIRNRATEKLLSFIASPGGITRAPWMVLPRRRGCSSTMKAARLPCASRALCSNLPVRPKPHST